MADTEGEGGTPPAQTHATVQHAAICSLDNFALVTQLPLKYLRQLEITQMHLASQIAIRIVCRTEDDSPGSVVFQISLEGDHRYQWRSRDRPMPYGCDQLSKGRDQGRILLVRHLSDALVLRRMGLPALAMLDAYAALDALTEPLQAIPTLYILAPEVERTAISQWISRSGLARRVKTLQLPGDAPDLTAVYRAAPHRFLDTMNQALT